MMPRIGIIDSGVGDALSRHVVASCRFGDPGGSRLTRPDSIGHGDALARLALHHCPGAELLIAQVFFEERRAPVSRVANALEWLVNTGASVINMSFGLTVPSGCLTDACTLAASQGALLVASSPAIGSRAFPAELNECLAVTGDARCGAGDIAWLGQPHAELGACPMIVPGQPQFGGGSSFACARVSGVAARLLAEGVAPSLLISHLRKCARYIGPERCRT